MTRTATGSLIRRLRANAASRGDGVAFRKLGNTGTTIGELTWSELWDAGQSVSGLLSRSGLTSKRVGLLSSDPLDFVVGLSGIACAGAIAVPLPATLGRRSLPRLKSILAAASLDCVLAGDQRGERRLLDDAGENVGPIFLISEARAAAERGHIDCDPHPDNPLLIQFTSGSTGEPRGVLLTHGNVEANCEAMAGAFDLSSASVGVSWLPFHHDMGLVGHVLVPMWVGGRSVLLDPLAFLQKPLRWLDACSRERATITSAPNFAFELCARCDGDDAPDLDLSSLETAICGGEPVIPDTWRRFTGRYRRFGFRPSAFAPSYGLAEATLLVTTSKAGDGPKAAAVPASPGAPHQEATCLGFPVDSTRIRVTNPQTCEELPIGTCGEVEVSGPGVGRALAPEGIAGTKDGWLHTGDLGFLGADGLCVVGRLKELIIIRGQNVYPADIESAALKASLRLVPGGIAAIGIARDGTEELAVVAEARDVRGSGDSAALVAAVLASIGSGTGIVPRDVLFARPGSLPRTSSGKLRRGLIASMYTAGQLDDLRRRFAAEGTADV